MQCVMSVMEFVVLTLLLPHAEKPSACIGFQVPLFVLHVYGGRSPRVSPQGILLRLKSISTTLLSVLVCSVLVGVVFMKMHRAVHVACRMLLTNKVIRNSSSPLSGTLSACRVFIVSS